jgi:hypothetical protein
MRFIVNLEKIRNLAGFCSTEETRYYLQGVVIQPRDGGAFYAATNGHILGSFESDGIVPETVILKVTKDFLAACKKIQRDWRNVELRYLTFDADKVFGTFPAYLTVDLEPTAEEMNIQRQVAVELIDGTFPDWQRIFPQELTPLPHASRLAVDAANLAAFAFAPEKPNGHNNPAAGCMFYAPAREMIRGNLGEFGSAPIVVFRLRHPDFVGLLMPYPQERHAAADMPAWVKARFKIQDPAEATEATA